MPSDSRKGVAVLGATGSVGRNAMAVLSAFPERYRVEAVTCKSRLAELKEVAASSGAREYFCAERPEDSSLPDEEALLALLQDGRVATVICAIQGIPALRCVLAALSAGKRVCLATKEVLVATGAWVTETARKNGGEILPVDSEHCAIFQCLQGERRSSVKKVWLTCSGGPFHDHPEIDLHAVTPEQALRHPTWNMGSKITLDCATLMNKAFEIVEASWLFGLPEEKVGVVIHPQSIVHSMVEYTDGAVLAQLGTTDMKLPIQYCLTYPERLANTVVPMDFSRMMSFQFLPPDTRRFLPLELARRVLRQGGAAGAVFNAANDAALRRFLAGTLAFDQIALAVEAALAQAPDEAPHSFEELQAATALAEESVRKF